MSFIDGKMIHSQSQQTSPDMSNQETSRLNKEDIGFTWWAIYGFLTLTVGNALLFIYDIRGIFLLAGIIINTTIAIGIFRKNKYIFLFGTILSFNPLVWFVNGVYLRNRWNHPEVNKNKDRIPLNSLVQSKATEQEISPSDEEAIYEQAAQELESHTLKKGLWAKAIAEADGNENIARARYIKTRSQQLLNESAQQAQIERALQMKPDNGGAQTPEAFETSRDRDRAMSELINRMKS